MKIVECVISAGGSGGVKIYSFDNFHGKTKTGESDVMHLMDSCRRQLHDSDWHEYPMNGFVKCIPMRFAGPGVLCDFPGIGSEIMNHNQLLDLR